jgi:Cdc6-like AAA superfamily ATPase
LGTNAEERRRELLKIVQSREFVCLDELYHSEKVIDRAAAKAARQSGIAFDLV